MAKNPSKLSNRKSNEDSQLHQVTSTPSHHSYIKNDVHSNNHSNSEEIICKNNNREVMPSSSSVEIKNIVQNAQSSAAHHSNNTTGSNVQLSRPQSSLPAASSGSPENEESKGFVKCIVLVYILVYFI